MLEVVADPEDSPRPESTCVPPVFNLAAEAGGWVHSWPDGLIAADRECRVVFLSVTAAELLGWTTDTAAGRKLHELLCSRSRDCFHSEDDCPLCREQIEPERIYSSDWVTKEGVNISVDYRVFPTSDGIARRVVSFYDNRQRIHSYREMVKFAEYVERSPAPIAEFDAEGQLLFGNPALQAELLLHGFDERGIARIWPANLSALCQQAWAQERVINDVEVQIDDNWYRWHFHPVTSSANGRSVLGYVFDVTEQKLAEVRLAEEKMAARRDFFAKMVHELRTPLNSIIGFSQVLIHRLEPLLDDRDIANLRAIRIAGLQLNELVSDTLDVAKIEAGKMAVELERFRLKDIFESFQDQVATLTDAKKLKYVCRYDPELTVHSDFRKVRQILLNLISNAIKYTHAGGITVTAQVAPAGDRLVLEVRDTGIGIPAEQLVKLFRTYEQVSEERDRAIQGTGLGLALVADAVALLQGSVQVESESGSGSLFRVTLPIDPVSSTSS